MASRLSSSPFKKRVTQRPEPVQLVGKGLTCHNASTKCADLSAQNGGPGWRRTCGGKLLKQRLWRRSEEHTSELQSLMRISYAVFCWKKKKSNWIDKQRE